MPKYNIARSKVRCENSFHPSLKLKATASVNIYGVFAVRDIKIMEGSKGLFISCPATRPETASTDMLSLYQGVKAEFDKAVIGAYQQTLTQGQAPHEVESSNSSRSKSACHGGCRR